MKRSSLKPILFKLHRWVGIGLMPLFLIIALSGAVLALKPMLQEQPAAVAAGGVSAEQAIALLQQLDPLGQEVEAVTVDAQSGNLVLRSQNPDLQGSFDPADGSPVANVQAGASFDLFEFAEHLHKELLFGADILVQIASYLMLLLVIIAPLIAWPRFRNNLMGWHRAAGWLLLPLILLLPLTGVLMSLHVGMPELPRMSEPGISLPLADALEKANQTYDLSHLSMARRFKGGSVLLGTQGETGSDLLVVTDNAVTPIDPSDNWVKSLHEGTWGGAWSGALNLLGALGLTLLTVSGFISWQRRRRKRRLQQAKRRQAPAMAETLT